MFSKVTWFTAALAFLVAWYTSSGSTSIEGFCPYVAPDTNGKASAQDARASFETPLQGNVSTCTFSESYFEARAKFRQLADLAGLETFVLPVVGDMYTIDVAISRGTDPGVVIHMSGTHGVEGYAGSAIQMAYMEGLARAAGTGSSPQPTVVLVHAVNPYGMAHFRRFNEENVDLNRNGLHEDEWPDALQRDPNLAGYADFDSVLFNPPHAPTWVDAYVRVWLQAGLNIARHGFVHMKRAIVAAQYHKPDGIYFGGTRLQKSHRVLRDFIREQIREKGTVTIVDVHTGLGPSGRDTLMPEVRAGSNLDILSEADKYFPGAFAVNDIAAGRGDVAAGYEQTIGNTGKYYTRMFEHARKPFLVTQEFGTLPGVFVARAMILENQAFVYAPQEQPAWSTFSRDAFYVRTREWRKAVLGRGLTLLHQAIARSLA